MGLHEIKKQKLLKQPMEKDVIKLARAIYNTYLQNDKNPHMKIKIANILRFLNLDKDKETIKYLRYLFEELNEPLCVQNFTFITKFYPMRFVVFCSYVLKNETVDITISEEYLCVQKEYMLDSFL